MGRPLNKKWFGNENTGGIAGSGVASVTINTAGTYTAGLPTVEFSAPNLAGGDTATGIVHGQALSAATTANGTAYRVGDVLTVAGGTRTSSATFPVGSITTLGTPTITNGGSLYDINSPTDGDKVTFTHANLSTPLIVRITAVSGSTATTIVVEQHGIWTGTGAFPTSMAGGVGGFTATTTAKVSPPGDTNGTGLVLGFTGSNWGVYSFGTVVAQGDYTAMPSNPVSFTGGNGTSAAADITFGVKNVEITDAGNGYTSVADAAPEFSSGTAAGTSVLTTSSGIPYTDNAFETILANAFIPTLPPAAGSEGYVSGTGGSSSVLADIVKQQATRRFRVETAQGIGYCNLVAGAPAAGQMTITATDSNSGKTYYVTKLTSRRATVVPYGAAGHLFPLVNGEPQSVHWTMTTTDTTYDSATTVIINNANNA
jgi:hypothetical protein